MQKIWYSTPPYRIGLAAAERTSNISNYQSTKISHLEDAAGVLNIKLTAEEVAYLEDPYVPHPINGHN